MWLSTAARKRPKPLQKAAALGEPATVSLPEQAANHRECYNIYNAALALYPNNQKLLRVCLNTAINCVSDGGAEPVFIAEIERVAKLIFDYGKDMGDIANAHNSLVHMYNRLGDFAKAKEHALVLPEFAESRRIALARVYQASGEAAEQAKANSQNIRVLLTDMEFQLVNLGGSYAFREQYEDAIEVYSTIIRVYEAMYGEDALAYAIMGAATRRKIAVNYLMLGENEKAVDWLEKTVDFCVANALVFGAVTHTERAVMRDADLDMTGVSFNLKWSIENELAFPIIGEKLGDNPRYVALTERVNALE